MQQRILIVDDEKDFRELMAYILRQEMPDVEVELAADGSECLARLEAGFRGVILMDVLMPGWDGWETIRQMVSRGLHEKNLVFMLTAFPPDENAARGSEAVVIDYIMKPPDVPDLVRRIKDCTRLMEGAAR